MDYELERDAKETVEAVEIAHTHYFEVVTCQNIFLRYCKYCSQAHILRDATTYPFIWESVREE